MSVLTVSGPSGPVVVCVVDLYVLYDGANGLQLLNGESNEFVNDDPKSESTNISSNGVPRFSTFVTVVPGACVSSDVERPDPKVNGSDIDGKLIDENNDAHDTDGVSSIATIEIASDSVTNSFLLMYMPPSTLDTRLQL